MTNNTKETKIKKVAFLSQKGGVSKSALSQSFAVEMARIGIKVLLADCDPKQLTSLAWNQDRKINKVLPHVDCKKFNTIKELFEYENLNIYDLIVIDGPARATEGTLLAAQNCDLIIQPSSSSDADLKPAFREFTSLIKKGIPAEKLWIAPSRLSLESELEEIKVSCKGETETYKKNEFKFNCLENFIFERSNYKKTLKEGKALTEDKFYSLRSKAFELIEEIVKKIYR